MSGSYCRAFRVLCLGLGLTPTTLKLVGALKGGSRPCYGGVGPWLTSREGSGKAHH